MALCCSQGLYKRLHSYKHAEVLLHENAAELKDLFSHDSLAVCSPDGMIRSVRNCPSASMLADLKDCLDFCSNSWVSLFCQLGGADLLLQVTLHVLQQRAHRVHDQS